MKKRVAVTGLGVVSALGNGAEEFWSQLTAGKSGISRLEGERWERFPTRIGGIIKNFEISANLQSKESRSWDRYVQFAVEASLQALNQAGWKIPEDQAHRTGVFIGSGIGGLGTLTEAHSKLLKSTSFRTTPYLVPMMITNMGAGIVSIVTGAKGPCSAPVSACATGNNAIGDAFRQILCGNADVMIAGGAEAPITELAFSGFCSLQSMSTRNDEPERASRPFDASRSGFVMSEGAGILVLEEWEHALTRGANILAEVVGYGLTSDAHHMTSPDPSGDGAFRAMQLAAFEAGWQPKEIEYINAHGTGTQLGDKAETSAIKKLLGADAAQVAVSSTKSATGHLFGAAGGIEAVAVVQALRTGVLPPTINLEEADPECDLDYVPLRSRKRNIEKALSNGFGFGGHNAVIAFQKV